MIRNTTILVDRALARRLERCEAHANASFVEARAAIASESAAEGTVEGTVEGTAESASGIAPATKAAWQDIDGTWAMFDGVGSPLTQSFGFGMHTDPSDERMARLEQFFFARGSDAMHEISVVADPAVLPILAARGYHPMEWSQVLCQPLTNSHGPFISREELAVRATTRDEADGWADVAARGWSSEGTGLEDFIRAFGQVNARAKATSCFLVESGGMPIAAGALHIHEGVALLAGASTIPSARGRGAQRALLEARLAFAVESGCDLAMMVAAPGSTSQKNAQRAGFQIAYSRVKWMKAAATP